MKSECTHSDITSGKNTRYLNNSSFLTLRASHATFRFTISERNWDSFNEFTQCFLNFCSKRHSIFWAWNACHFAPPITWQKKIHQNTNLSKVNWKEKIQSKTKQTLTIEMVEQVRLFFSQKIIFYEACFMVPAIINTLGLNYFLRHFGTLLVSTFSECLKPPS